MARTKQKRRAEPTREVYSTKPVKKANVSCGEASDAGMTIAALGYDGVRTCGSALMRKDSIITGDEKDDMITQECSPPTPTDSPPTPTDSPPTPTDSPPTPTYSPPTPAYSPPTPTDSPPTPTDSPGSPQY